MSLVTATEAQARGIGLDLSPADLQTLLNREEAEIVRRFGVAAAAITERVYPRGRSLYLKRAVATVTSITESWYAGDPAPTTRAAADYVVWGDEGRIERAAGSQAWGRLCVVVYTPVDDSDLRREVILELARAASEQTSGGGVRISGLGYTVDAAQATATSWHDARNAAYARLGWHT